MRISLTTRFSGALSLLLLSTLPAMAADKEQREPHEPAYSADGTRLVYREDVTKAGEVLPSSSEIWIVNRDGTGARALTSGAKDEHPRLSPDGKLIAFTRDRDIWLVGADGSNLRNLTNTRDATESGAEFTRLGDLVFIRHKRDVRNDETLAKALAKEPLIALGLGAGVQSVVLHQFSDGSERVLLNDGYGVEQIVPNIAFDDAIFVLCRRLDAEGRPVERSEPGSAVAVVKLHGGAPQTVFAPPPEAKVRMRRLRVVWQRNVLVIETPEHPAGQVAILEDGKFIPLPDAPIFGDVSRDGKTIAGIGIVKGQASLFGLVLHDIETKETKPVLRAPPPVN